MGPRIVFGVSRLLMTWLASRNPSALTPLSHILARAESQILNNSGVEFASAGKSAESLLVHEELPGIELRNDRGHN